MTRPGTPNAGLPREAGVSVHPATGGERHSTRRRSRLSCLAVGCGILVVDLLVWAALAVLGARTFGWWGE